MGAGVVVGALVAGDGPREALASEDRGLVGDLAGLPSVDAEPSGGFGPAQPVVEFPEGQERCIAS